MREQMFERMVLEMQRSLDHFDRQFSHLLVSNLVITPVPAEIGLTAYLSEQLYVAVEEMRLDQHLDTSAVSGFGAGAGGDLLMTLGAARRQEAA